MEGGIAATRHERVASYTSNLFTLAFAGAGGGGVTTIRKGTVTIEDVRQLVGAIM